MQKIHEKGKDLSWIYFVYTEKHKINCKENDNKKKRLNEKKTRKE